MIRHPQCTIRTTPKLAAPLLLFCALIVACGAKRAETSDSKSNWLEECAKTADCQSGYSCVAQLCVMDCRQEESCAGPTQQCVRLDEVEELRACMGDWGERSQCLTTCAADADCSGLGAALSCAGGYCLPTSSCTAPPPVGTTGPAPSGTPTVMASDAGPDVVPPDASSSDPPAPSTPAPSNGVIPSAPSTGDASVSTPPDAAPTCPALAEQCPAGCYDIDAFAADLRRQCVASTLTHLGCTELDFVTDDAICIATADGSTLYSLSGTHADVLVATGEFVDCSDAEWERLSQGFDACGSDAGGASGPVVESDRRYTAGIVNGIDCCDFVDVILADAAEDYCVVVSLEVPVGGVSTVIQAWGTRPADGCELGGRVPEDAVIASSAEGTGGVDYGTRPAVVEVDARVTFSDGSALPASLDVRIDALPLDREWHDGP